MKKLVVTSVAVVLTLALQSPVFGQAGSMGLLGVGRAAGGSNPTPGFVNSSLSASSEEKQVTTLVSGTTTCTNNFAFCAAYAEPTLAGNSGIVAVTYGATSSEVPTVTDDKGNTYTHATAGGGCEANDSTNHRWLDIFYSVGLATGTHAVFVTFPATVTNVQVIPIQKYNVGSFDTCSIGSSTSSVTSFTAGNLTTTTGNDMVDVFTVETNPTNSTTTGNNLGPFAADSGWNQIANGHRDGFAAAWEVDATAGTITPKMTSGSSGAYVAAAIAMKSNTSGNAPSGMYIACMGSLNSEFSSSPSTVTEGTPCGTTGNMVFLGLGGGGSAANTQATAVSDGTNTWAQAGSPVLTSGSDWSSSWYTQNATISNSLAPAVTMNWQGGNGDVSYWWYVVAGSNPTAGPAAYMSNLQGSQTGTGSTFTITTTAQAAASSSYDFLHFTQDQNTETSVTAPTCGIFDTNFNAGELLDGPWPVDQNNVRSHCVLNDSTALQTWTYGLTNSTTAVDSYGGQFVAFPMPGAVWMKDPAASGEATSGNNETVSFTTTATEVLIVGVDAYQSPAVTISSVCLDGNSTCSTGTLLTARATSLTTGVAGSQGATEIFDIFGVTAGAHTITAVASAAVGHMDVVVYPVIGISTFDLASKTQNGSVSAGAASGPSITTTGNPGFVLSIFGVSNACSASPASGNEFSVGSGIFTSQDCWAALISTAAAAHSPSVADAAGTFNDSIAAYK